MLTRNKEPTWIKKTWGKRHDEHEEKRLWKHTKSDLKKKRSHNKQRYQLITQVESALFKRNVSTICAWYCSSKKTHSHENKGHEDWEENDAKVGLERNNPHSSQTLRTSTDLLEIASKWPNPPQMSIKCVSPPRLDHAMTHVAASC